MGDELLLSDDRAVRMVTMNRPQSHNVDPHVSIGLTAADGVALLWPCVMSLTQAGLGLTNRVTSPKHIAQAAVAIVDYGLAAETLELSAAEHIDKVRNYLGADKYDAIAIPADADGARG